MISIVIPVYNEEKNIKPLYDRLGPIIKKYKYEVFFVDDGSKDGTVKEIVRLRKKDNKVRLFSLNGNHGKAAALQAGFDYVSGDIIITMDGDLQDLPEEIPKFVKALEKSDLVVGWRHERRDKFTKKIASFIFNNLKGLTTGLRIHDSNCGFKAMRKEVAKSIKLYGEMHRYLPALAYIKGYKVSEIRIKHAERLHGKTKYGVSRMWRGFFDLLTVKFLSSFARKPFHLFGGLGFLGIFLGGVIGFYLAALWFLTGTIGGQTGLAMMSVLSIITGVQLISLGLIGEMVASTKNTDTYHIKRKL